MAGTAATLATHPFDILKTRLQTDPRHGRASGPTKALSLLGTARHVWRTEGSGAFLDGLGLRCARKAASSAIGWGIFEAGRGAWARRDEARRRE
jgi:solute carrier family 25 protein 38